ncbi:DNA polymerase III subunit delta [Candidatus Uhrbacteria bacterium]|jgi:DNA polymerase III subunit delta|nr:DNA polymerase III subunit delta [Candidatus Uhrbacteria bacterium]
MLIFVFGENTYSSLHKLAQLREHFVAKHDPSGMNVAEFVVGKVKFGEVMSGIQAPPFLGAKRMVIVRGLCETYSTKKDAKEWIEAFARIPESTIVVVWDGVSVKKMVRHAMVKAFVDQEGVHSYPFEALAGGALSSWADQYAKQIGLSIDRRLLGTVVSRVGSDLWQLSGELEKLAAYSGGTALDETAIDLLVRTNSDDQMFALMDALSGGQYKRVLGLLSSQRQFGTSDHQLFAMLSRQIRLLLSVRDLLDSSPGMTKQDVASSLSLHPFVAQKTLSQARGFTKDQLLHIQTLLYRLDKLIKNGKVDMEFAMDRAVIGMSSGS